MNERLVEVEHQRFLSLVAFGQRDLLGLDKLLGGPLQALSRVDQPALGENQVLLEGLLGDLGAEDEMPEGVIVKSVLPLLGLVSLDLLVIRIDVQLLHGSGLSATRDAFTWTSAVWGGGL